MSCPLTVSESSRLYFEMRLWKHTAFSPHHPALSGALPGSSALLVLTFRLTWINETSYGGMSEAPPPPAAHILQALWDTFSPEMSGSGTRSVFFCSVMLLTLLLFSNACYKNAFTDHIFQNPWALFSFTPRPPANHWHIFQMLTHWFQNY